MDGDRTGDGSITRRWVSRPANWPPGPWDDEPDERIWVDEFSGLTCRISRDDWGYLCGYVVIPHDHPLHGDIERTRALLRAGKDLNFVGFLLIETMEGDQWHVGFDCAHHTDLSPHLMAIAQDDRFPGIVWDKTYRTWRYVQSECESIARQIALMRPASAATAAAASRPARPTPLPTATPAADPPSPGHPPE